MDVWHDSQDLGVRQRVPVLVGLRARLHMPARRVPGAQSATPDWYGRRREATVHFRATMRSYAR